MTVVACLSVVPSLQLFPQYPAPRSLGPPGTRLPVDELIDLVRPEIDRHGTMLVVAPMLHADELVRDLLVVRNAVGPGQLVVIRTGLPPLATAVLASQLAAVTVELKATGQVLAGAAVLQQRLGVLAWLSRVDKLERPGPSLRQHAGSLLPWTRFLVCVQPDPFVRRIRHGTPPPGIRQNDGPWLAVLAPSGDGSRWLREQAVPRTGAQRVVEVGVPPLSTRWWGSQRLAELVVCPDSPSLLAPWIRESRPCVPCPWCGEPVYGARCPVCSMVLTAAAELAGGVR